MIPIGMVMDQIGKRYFANNPRGNSLFGFIYGVSFHAKDIKDKLISYDTCQSMLTKKIDVINCKKITIRMFYELLSPISVLKVFSNSYEDLFVLKL